MCASFGPGIIRKRVRLSEIVGCEPIRIRWWYGWGIHLTPYGWLYNVSGFDAVAITLQDGRKFALGTDDSSGLVDAIRRYTNTHLPRGRARTSERWTTPSVKSKQCVYFAKSRNQRKATEVCPSFTSCAPWKVPIRIRLNPVRLIEPATVYCCSTVAIRSS